MSNVGLNTEILDGNLTPRVSLPENVTLVIDRATSGISDSIYLVSDSDTAKRDFGANSPLIQGMRHAYAGGAKNVALYRIGGAPSTITNIFGEFTSLKTVSQQVGAGNDLKVYVGPRSDGDSVNVVIVKDSKDRVVYSNVPGMKVDLGVVELDGFDSTNIPFTVGTLSSFVPFNQVASTVTTINGIETVSPRSTNKVLTLTYKYDKVTQVVLSDNGSTTLVEGTDYSVGVNADGTKTTITLAKDADVNGIYTIHVTSATVSKDLAVTYTPAYDSLNVKLNKLYELYDKAFINLEAIDIAGVVLPDLFNVNNLADGYQGNEDCLTYVKRTEAEDGYTYDWSDIKTTYKSTKSSTGTTTDISLADLDLLGTPIVVSQYNEVDFAHRVGMWAWGQSSSSTYVNASIGVKKPKSSSRVAITVG